MVKGKWSQEEARRMARSFCELATEGGGRGLVCVRRINEAGPEQQFLTFTISGEGETRENTVPLRPDGYAEAVRWLFHIGREELLVGLMAFLMLNWGRYIERESSG